MSAQPLREGRDRLREVVPSNKFDLEAVDRATSLGWPAVEPVIGDLLGWLRDMNWPVAQRLRPLLASIGAPLAPHIEPILKGDDAIWKYWIIEQLVKPNDDLRARCAPQLQRLADSPSAQERMEELDAVASRALGWWP